MWSQHNDKILNQTSTVSCAPPKTDTSNAKELSWFCVERNIYSLFHTKNIYAVWNILQNTVFYIKLYYSKCNIQT